MYIYIYNIALKVRQASVEVLTTKLQQVQVFLASKVPQIGQLSELTRQNERLEISSIKMYTLSKLHLILNVIHHDPVFIYA